MGEKFEAREFAEAIWVALTADGSKRERTERTLNLRERLWEAGDAWETAHGADFTNEHLRERAREEEAKAQTKKQAKKPKVHYVHNCGRRQTRSAIQGRKNQRRRGREQGRATWTGSPAGCAATGWASVRDSAAYKVHMAGENGKVLCSFYKRRRAAPHLHGRGADHLQGLPL